ncbi:hypothetical protein K3495_g5354 [Podosphaera aphanis]|nr:hypothetical protein K3495_g5354 [Podosphaera aphanis]
MREQAGCDDQTRSDKLRNERLEWAAALGPRTRSACKSSWSSTEINKPPWVVRLGRGWMHAKTNSSPNSASMEGNECTREYSRLIDHASPSWQLSIAMSDIRPATRLMRMEDIVEMSRALARDSTDTLKGPLHEVS